MPANIRPLALSGRVGVSAAAREQGLQTQLYQWRAKAQQQQSASDRELPLPEEYERLEEHYSERTRM